MNTSSSRRSLSRALSVSSEPSTPIPRRRKSRQTMNTTLQNTSTKSTTSSPRTLRRLQPKSKTIK